MTRYSHRQSYTAAGPVRDHLHMLASRGISWRSAADLAGLSHHAVNKILNSRGAPPPERVYARTAARILAIRGALDALPPTAIISAAGTHRRLQALVVRGWSQKRLAGRLALPSANTYRLLRQEQVTAATARAVRALYDELWDQAPPERDRWEKVAAARSRRYAAERGWAPPMAWDDDQIDNPDATPAPGWRPGKGRCHGALAEDAAELIARGLTRTEAAARLGVHRDAVDVALRRAARHNTTTDIGECA